MSDSEKQNRAVLAQQVLDNPVFKERISKQITVRDTPSFNKYFNILRLQGIQNENSCSWKKSVIDFKAWILCRRTNKY